MIREIGRFEIDRRQQQLFKSGPLPKAWRKQYPQLFDSDDWRLAASQGPLGYHFVEWLAAILLFHMTGFRSLVSKYEFKRHSRKKRILERLVSPEVLDLIRDRSRFGNTQCPDLLVYSPKLDDWFFCEVKGPGDRLSAKQREYFELLASTSGKEVGVIRFRWRT
jgi:hypothetical protein